MTNSAAGIPLLHAWDMGGNWGHMVRLLDLRQSLVDAGFKVYSAVNRVAEYGQVLAENGITVLQAPVSYSGPLARFPSMAHRYFAHGWGCYSSLLGQVEAWRNLITLTGARLVLADATVPGLIAARTLGVPVVNFSTPYHILPAANPYFYLQQPPDPPSEFSLLEVAAALDHAMRQVFRHYGLVAPGRVTDIFAVEEPGFFCFPELDHYGQRPGQSYWGPFTGSSIGAPADWPDGGGPKVFAYLRLERAGSEQVIRSLAALGWPTVIACPGMTQAVLETLNLLAPSLRIYDRMIDVGQASRMADLVVNHAGMGLTHAALLAGKPLAMLPDGHESEVTAIRVAKMGAGLVLPEPDNPMPDYASVLRDLAASHGMRAAARDFALAHADHTQDDLVRRVAARCRELVDRAE